MISKPVFDSVVVHPHTTWSTAGYFFAIDLLFTLPAYLVIFHVIWWFIQRYHYSYWQYVAVMGLGQVLGDGGIYFFVAAPPMLFFLPYPMSNYHAVNILPYEQVAEQLPTQRVDSKRKYWAVPALIAIYFVCGVAIQVVGRKTGWIG